MSAFATVPTAVLPTSDAAVAPPEPWCPRSDASRAAQQVEAIAAFARARRRAEQAQAAAVRSRETRMDVTRRLQVLRRTHDAVVDRAQHSLQRSSRILLVTGLRTALLAHRNEWFLDRIGQHLRDAGVDVVGRTDNGADAVGYAVAEQPDLVLVEDRLAMVPGEHVVQEVVRYCPATRVVAQVASADRVGVLFEAGAVAVYTRRVPPVDVAAAMHRMVTA